MVVAVDFLSARSAPRVTAGLRRSRQRAHCRGKRACALAASSALPATARRLEARRPGGGFGEVAKVVDFAPRAPGTAEVAVRVRFAGINGGCETFRARAEHWFERNRALEGFALGAEGSGEVVAVGEGVEGLAVGDAVAFVGGAFAEFTTVPAVLCQRVDSPSAEAAALIISGTTAAVSVGETGGAAPGEKVLVTAAAGGAGHLALQLAAMKGCDVVATCGGAEKAALVSRLATQAASRGTAAGNCAASMAAETVVIDHTQEDICEAIAREGPYDLAVEHVGGRILDAAMDSLSGDASRLLIVGYISESPHNGIAAPHLHGDLAERLFWGQQSETLASGATVRGNVWPEDRALVRAARDHVFELHREGLLEVVTAGADDFVGLDRVPAAVEEMLSGRTLGKVVATIAPC